MQILGTVYLKCTCHLVPTHFTSHHKPIIHDTAVGGPSTSSQYALCVLFVSPTLSPNGTLDDTTAPARDPYSFIYKPNTLDGDCIVVPAGCGLGRLGPDHGVARRLRRESVG